MAPNKAVDRIIKKAQRLHDLHIVHINSTYYGGGVAELLSSLTLLMNAAGVRTGWRVIQGRPDFFMTPPSPSHTTRRYSTASITSFNCGMAGWMGLIFWPKTVWSNRSACEPSREPLIRRRPSMF